MKCDYAAVIMFLELDFLHSDMSQFCWTYTLGYRTRLVVF